MKIKYDLTSDELFELRKYNEMELINISQLENSIRSIKYKVSLYDGKCLIGCGSILSDNSYYGIINNFIVKKGYESDEVYSLILSSLFSLIESDLYVGEKFLLEAFSSDLKSVYTSNGINYNKDRKCYYKWFKPSLHTMKLQPDPFNKIISGVKDIEIRLYDSKRQNINNGDLIEFTNVNDNTTVMVRVKSINVFDSFKDLFDSYDNKRLGMPKNEDYSIMDKYYSKEEQSKYKVVALEIARI